MTTKELIKKYGEGKGEKVMWQSVDIISAALDAKLSPEEMDQLECRMYELMQGPHFDEYFAEKQVQEMYYTDLKGEKREAPYWTADAVKQVWTQYRNKIRDQSYTFWDFYVVMNMIKSDNCNLYRGWWPDADDSILTQKIAESSVNWLNDEDDPLGGGRAWRYFNRN